MQGFVPRLCGSIPAVSWRRVGTALAVLGSVACSAEITEPSAPVATVSISAADSWVENGQMLPLTAILKDSAGNLLSDRSVTWKVSDTTLATIDSQGRLTGRMAPPRRSLSGLYVTATSEAKVASISIRTGNKPATIVLLTTGGGTYKAGACIGLYCGLLVELRILDSRGDPVWGVAPRLTTETGLSYIDGTIANKHGSRDDGYYSVQWYLSTTPGEKSFTASFPGATSATIRATVVTGDPGRVVKVAGDMQTAARVETVPVRPSIRLTDWYNNPIAGATVRFTVTAGGGSVTGADVVTDATGIATVGSWTLGPAAGANTLRVTTLGVPGPTAEFNATGQ